jgi:phospholipid-binding lipoprotein MlaA
VRGWLWCLWSGILVCALFALAPPAPAAEPDPLFEDTGDAVHFPDPLEDSNRTIFGMNHAIDNAVLSPLSRTYQRLPEPIRRSVRLFFQNLNSPSILVNDILQREWRAAGVSAARTGINSTVGVAGFFDPATSLGFPFHNADFGQTLALAGMPSGPYVIVPLLGPTNARDGFGTIIDFAFRPTTYLLGPLVFGGLGGFGDQLVYTSIQGGGTGFITRASVQREMDALHDSSMDFYATLRTAYYQARTADIWENREHHKAKRERALFIRRCQSSELRSYRAGSPTARRILPASRRRCSPRDVAPAR